NPATRRSFSLLSSGMVSTYSLKWTPACPGIHRDESASAMSAYKHTGIYCQVINFPPESIGGFSAG
ncbi:hypothetical protein, partial [Burkholderia vietnamiensis]|uniref:hypothetical protein n=1 Tax=Burkholderia vietnamiensis TaxID=60552 RepID=UPI002652FB83